MVAPNVAKSSKVCISYSMTKLQYSLTAKNNAVSSCDLSDSPTIRKRRLEVVKCKPHEERWKPIKSENNKTIQIFRIQCKNNMIVIVNMSFLVLRTRKLEQFN